MQKIFSGLDSHRKHKERKEIRADDHKPIPPAFYKDNEEWVKKYRERFDTDPSFF